MEIKRPFDHRMAAEAFISERNFFQTNLFVKQVQMKNCTATKISICCTSWLNLTLTSFTNTTIFLSTSFFSSYAPAFCYDGQRLRQNTKIWMLQVLQDSTCGGNFHLITLIALILEKHYFDTSTSFFFIWPP